MEILKKGARHPEKRMAQLRFIGPDGREHIVPLGEKAVTLGRSMANDIVLQESIVSRKHAEIAPEGEAYVISDLASKGGTFVNGERIDRRRLGDKDILNIGTLAIHFEMEPGGGATAPDEFATPSVLGDTQERVTWSQPLSEMEGGVPSLSEDSRRYVEAVRAEIAELEEGPDAIDRVVQLAMEGVVAERGFLFLKSSDGLLPVVEIDPKIKLRRLNISTTIVDKVLGEEIAVITRDAVMDPELDGCKSVVELGIRSALCAPMKVGDRVAGVIYLDTTDPERRFTRGDLSLLVALADLVSRRFEKELLPS